MSINLRLLTLFLASLLASPACSRLLETACMGPTDPMVDVGPAANAGCPEGLFASGSVACCGPRNASSTTPGLVCSRPAGVGCFDGSST